MKKFKIKLSPKGKRYIQGYFFDTHEEMVNHLRKNHPHVPPYKACTEFVTKKNKVCSLYFTKEYTNLYSIVHECIHTLFYCIRKGKLKDPKEFDVNNEERICTVFEYIYGQILHSIPVDFGKRSRKTMLLEYKHASRFYGFR